MIYDVFNLSGDNDAILEFRDVSKVQLKNESFEVFDTKSGTKYHRRSLTGLLTAYLRVCTRCKLEKSDELKYLLASLRSRDDIRRQKIRLLRIEVDGSQTSRSENQRFSFQSDKSRRGQTCNRSSELRKRQRKRQGQCLKNNCERGACVCWMTKGHCSFGEACAFKRDPKKKGKREGRLRSPSPTGSPHGNSKGDGKGIDDGGATGTPKFTGKSQSGAANRLFCTNLKRGEIHVITGASSRMYNIPSSRRMQIGRQVCKQTHNNIFRWKEQFSIDCNSHSIDWWTTDAITAYSVGLRDPIPSETSLSREQVLSEKRKPRDAHLDSSRQDPQISEIQTLSNIRGTIHRMDFAHNSTFVSENRLRFFKPSPASNVSSSLSVTTSKWEKILVDSGASLVMMSKSDLTPEEPEKIQKSKDPSIVMTGNGTTRTTEQATVSVRDLEMFCSSSIIERITRGTFAVYIVRRKRLLVWCAFRSAIISHQEREKLGM